MRKSSKEDRSNTTGYGSDEDSYIPAFHLDRGNPENSLTIQIRICQRQILRLRRVALATFYLTAAVRSCPEGFLCHREV